MAQRGDFQIWWIVLAAAFFWVVIWQHEFVSKWSHTAFIAAVAMTSGLRTPAPPPPAPVEANSNSKRVPGKATPKGAGNSTDITKD
jgi:hypothetical protein